MPLQLYEAVPYLEFSAYAAVPESLISILYTPGFNFISILELNSDKLIKPLLPGEVVVSFVCKSSEPRYKSAFIVNALSQSTSPFSDVIVIGSQLNFDKESELFVPKNSVDAPKISEYDPSPPVGIYVDELRDCVILPLFAFAIVALTVSSPL